jgi:hypothetical protein
MPHCEVGVPDESSDAERPALAGQEGMSAGAQVVSAIEQFANSDVTAQPMFSDGVTNVTVPLPERTVVGPDEVDVVPDSVGAVVVTVFVTVADFSTMTVVSLPHPTSSTPARSNPRPGRTN